MKFYYRQINIVVKVNTKKRIGQVTLKYIIYTVYCCKNYFIIAKKFTNVLSF